MKSNTVETNGNCSTKPKRAVILKSTTTNNVNITKNNFTTSNDELSPMLSQDTFYKRVVPSRGGGQASMKTDTPFQTNTSFHKVSRARNREYATTWTELGDLMQRIAKSQLTDCQLIDIFSKIIKENPDI